MCGQTLMFFSFCSRCLWGTESKAYSKCLGPSHPTKANGHDDITPTASQLFSISIWLGELPEEWKIAHATPIPKSLNSIPENYCPISLLSALSKLLKMHVWNLLIIIDHLENYNPLFTHQWTHSRQVHNWCPATRLLDATDQWHRQLQLREHKSS